MPWRRVVGVLLCVVPLVGIMGVRTVGLWDPRETSLFMTGDVVLVVSAVALHVIKTWGNTQLQACPADKLSVANYHNHADVVISLVIMVFSLSAFGFDFTLATSILYRCYPYCGPNPDYSTIPEIPQVIALFVSSTGSLLLALYEILSFRGKNLLLMLLCSLSVVGFFLMRVGDVLSYVVPSYIPFWELVVFGNCCSLVIGQAAKSKTLLILSPILGTICVIMLSTEAILSLRLCYLYCPPWQLTKYPGELICAFGSLLNVLTGMILLSSLKVNIKSAATSAFIFIICMIGYLAVRIGQIKTMTIMSFRIIIPDDVLVVTASFCYAIGMSPKDSPVLIAAPIFSLTAFTTMLPKAVYYSGLDLFQISFYVASIGALVAGVISLYQLLSTNSSRNKLSMRAVVIPTLCSIPTVVGISVKMAAAFWYPYTPDEEALPVDLFALACLVCFLHCRLSHSVIEALITEISGITAFFLQFFDSAALLQLCNPYCDRGDKTRAAGMVLVSLGSAALSLITLMTLKHLIQAPPVRHTTHRV